MSIKMLMPLCLPLLFLVAARSDEAKDREVLDGTWLPLTAELSGKAFPEELRKTIQLVVKGDKYTVTVGKAVDQGTVKLNPAAMPKELDIIGTEGPNKGKTILAIYERNGDTLRVCYQLSGNGRPKEFKTTEGTQLFLVTYSREKDKSADARPASWAQPVALEGAPNLFKVSDSLFRSAQPTAEGMQNLKKRGIVTVVSLRSFHSDRDEIGSTGLAYEHIYMKAWHPERKEVVRFLQIVTDPKRTPVLVHCQHGADRTGTMSAIYRVVVDGWTKEDAIREMTQGGYGFHEVWSNLPEWIRDLDVESIRKDAGIKE